MFVLKKKKKKIATRPGYDLYGKSILDMKLQFTKIVHM